MRSARAQASSKASKAARRKRRAAKRDPQYLAWLRLQPCAVCLKRGGTPQDALLIQGSPTEAAHVGERGLGQKCPDREAIPLCGEHHRTGPLAHHVLGKQFFFMHSLYKTTLIQQYNTQYTVEVACVLSSQQ